MAKKPRRHRRKVQRSSMEAYVEKHIKSATSKLRYLEKKGGYKASVKAQQAKASLRMLYRKMGVDENSYHTGKTFTKLLISNADLRVLYNAISDIRSIDTKKANLKYKQLEEEFKKYKLTYAETFNRLSYISSEFHEVFAFLTYGELKTNISEGGNFNDKMILASVLERVSDKILDEGKTEKAKRLIAKFKDSLSSSDFNDLKSVYGGTINKITDPVGERMRRYSNASTRPVSKRDQSTGRKPKPKPTPKPKKRKK